MKLDPEVSQKHILEEASSETGVDGNAQECLQLCRQELERTKDSYMRTLADLENFKRRTQQERIEWRKSAQAEIFLRLIPIVDDLDRALRTREKQNNQEFSAWLEGFAIIGKQIHKFLDQAGVRPIEAVVDFDPEFHEALAQVESPSHTTGQIVEVFENGYTFNGVLLRPAKVSVAK